MKVNILKLLQIFSLRDKFHLFKSCLHEFTLLRKSPITPPTHTHTYTIPQRTEIYQNSLGNIDLSVKVTSLCFIAAKLF